MVMKMKEEFISIGKAARYLGKSIEGLRKWEADGVLIPRRTPTGHRRYHLSDLQKIMHDENLSPENNRCAIYARVSTKKQEEAGNVERQIGRWSTYCAQQNWIIAAIVTDVASGMNENRRGLQKILQMVSSKEASMVVVEYKDRLARFGFSYLETYIRAFGGSIVIIDQEEKNEQQELVEDLIAITTSFLARIYGERGGKKWVDAVSTALQDPMKEGEPP